MIGLEFGERHCHGTEISTSGNLTSSKMFSDSNLRIELDFMEIVGIRSRFHRRHHCSGAEPKMEKITKAIEKQSFMSDYVMRYRGSKVPTKVILELEALILNQLC